MKNKNTYLILAGVSNLLVALLHTIGGQIDLVNPLLNTTLDDEIKTQLLGAWHMVTIILFVSSIVLLSAGFGKNYKLKIDLLSFIGYLYLLFSIPFLIIGFCYEMLVPQWILLSPIGILTLMGIKRQHS